MNYTFGIVSYAHHVKQCFDIDIAIKSLDMPLISMFLPNLISVVLGWGGGYILGGLP